MPTTADNTLTSATITGNVSGLTLTSTNAAALTITESGPNPNAVAITLNQATLTGNHVITNSGTGAGNGALTVDLNSSAGAFTNTVNLAAGHTGTDTVILRAASTGVTAASSAVPALGYTIINDSSTTLSATRDVIQFSQAGLVLATNSVAMTGAAAAGLSYVSGAQNSWSLGTTGAQAVFIETGTFLPFTPGTTTWQSVATAIGTVTNVGTGKAIAVIQTAANSGVYDIFAVTFGAAHTAAALVAGQDAIQLVGVVNVTAGQSLVGTNFAVIA